jgi:hypothetical protein
MIAPTGTATRSVLAAMVLVAALWATACSSSPDDPRTVTAGPGGAAGGTPSTSSGEGGTTGQGGAGGGGGEGASSASDGPRLVLGVSPPLEAGPYRLSESGFVGQAPSCAASECVRGFIGAR